MRLKWYPPSCQKPLIKYNYITGANAGSGLGLYICRQLMNRMGGDIFAEIKDQKMIVTAVFGMA